GGGGGGAAENVRPPPQPARRSKRPGDRHDADRGEREGREAAGLDDWRRTRRSEPIAQEQEQEDETPDPEPGRDEVEPTEGLLEQGVGRGGRMPARDPDRHRD